MRKLYGREIKIKVTQDEWAKIRDAIHEVLWEWYPKLYLDCFPKSQKKVNKENCVDRYWFENLVHHVNITVKKKKIIIMDPNTKKIAKIKYG